MRILTLLFCSILFLSSCRKDSRDYTSDFPNGYRTDIYINYFAELNITQVQVVFNAGNPYDIYQSHGVALPPSGYLKYNGIEITIQPNYSYYEDYFPGKQIAVIEFKDYDGIIYANTIVPPDTAHFINLPDTITTFKDLQVQVNAPNLDSNETSNICLDSHSYDYGCDFYYGNDSIFYLNYSPTLESGTNHYLYLYRTKYISNPNLPLGGGSITYQYIVAKSFYVP